MSLYVDAYAKLNLSLRVLSRRPDGFHELQSEVQTIDLADRLTIEIGGSDLRFTTDRALDGENVAETAARMLLERKRASLGAQIRLEKRIPVGAGLGGGSSDAAAILNALDRLTPPRLSLDALSELGAELGSDVPLFLYGGRLRMEGRGERIHALSGRSTAHFVVLVPPIHCATGEIYAEWDAREPAPLASGDTIPAPGQNDLLAAAFALHPALVGYHEAMVDLGAEYSGMSGSGSSFFAAFDNLDTARRARDHLTRRFDNAKVYRCRPTTVGHRIQEAA